MEDLIRRSDAIAILEDLQSKHLQFCLVPFRIAIEKVQAIPSADIDLSEYSDKLWKNAYERGKADSPQGWIPCSERLPKKEEATYLICTETGHMCSCRWTNNMYGLRSNEWSKWGWHIMDKPQYAKVVAWMPLKPWKGAEDGEDIQSEVE